MDIQEHALLITHAHHAHASRTPVRTHQHARLYAHMGSSAFHRPSSKTVSLWHTRIRRTAFKVHTRAPTQAPTRRLTRRLARTFHRPTYLPGKQSHSSALEDTGRPSKFTCTSTPVTGTRALFTGPRTCPENSRTRAPSKTQQGIQSSHAHQHACHRHAQEDIGLRTLASGDSRAFHRPQTFPENGPAPAHHVRLKTAG